MTDVVVVISRLLQNKKKILVRVVFIDHGITKNWRDCFEVLIGIIRKHPKYCLILIESCFVLGSCG